MFFFKKSKLKQNNLILLKGNGSIDTQQFLFRIFLDGKFLNFPNFRTKPNCEISKIFQKLNIPILCTALVGTYVQREE